MRYYELLLNMSDGDAKESVKFLSERDNFQVERKKKKSGIDEFSQAIARIAVAQICENLGFQGIQESALGILADVGVRYIREVGRSAGFYASLANRSHCNALDVIQGLEDLVSVQGFSSASDVRHSLSESGAFMDVRRYVGQAEEIPFAYLIPSFPIVKERKLNPSFTQAAENPPYKYIPQWLPNFPDPETYLQLNLRDKYGGETLVENKVQQVAGHHRKVDRPLLDVQKQLVCNGSEAEVVGQGNSAKSQRTAESNPFLVPPLQFGEKEVSLPVLPTKLVNQASGGRQIPKVLENGDPVSNSSLPDVDGTKSDSSEPKMTKIILNGRPNIHFTFGETKKFLARAKNPSIKDVKKISFWFGNDHDGRDQNTTREEQNIEDPQDVSHL